MALQRRVLRLGKPPRRWKTPSFSKSIKRKIIEKPKRRTVVTHSGRSSVPEKSSRVRGRSPAFNALAATFENPNAKNLSTPPPMVRKLIYPKSVTPDSGTSAPKSAAIAALTASFEKSPPIQEKIYPKSIKASSTSPSSKSEGNSNENSMSSRIGSLTIEKDVKEGEAEDEEWLPIYPYERLTTISEDPIAEIDMIRRETYLSSAEFKEKFGMTKDAFWNDKRCLL